jgi:AcrR family transcriptional regulator
MATVLALHATQSRPPRIRNRATREGALLSAAGRLFASRGYESTTTREIAAEAGCAEGLIHRYFQGKAGLLLALIQSRMSQEVADLNERLPLALTLEDEILHLVEFELERMWTERDFFRVLIPRAILDPALGPIMRRLGPTRRAKAIAERLRSFPEAQLLSDEQIEALADSVGLLGFMFGFMRPVVLGDDRRRTSDIARTMARLLIPRQ